MKRLLLAALLCLFTLPAYAIDAISFMYGWDGEPDNINGGRVGLQWDWDREWLPLGSWHLNGYFELNGVYWRSSGDENNNHRSLGGVGFIPMFRYESQYKIIAPFVEAGIGVIYLTESRIGSENLGSNYQFDDRAGAGFRFGPRNQFSLAYQYNHYSNAGIKSPNDGMDLKKNIIFTYTF